MSNEWSLYLWKPYKNFPSKIYIWVNPNGVITFAREILPLGYTKTFDTGFLIEKKLKVIRKMLLEPVYSERKLNTKITKQQTKMTQEQLAQGQLHFG